MKLTVSLAALALAVLGATALAQTVKPDVSAAPSAQNSGAGIAGQTGNKSGPAAKPAGAVAPSSPNQQNPTDQQQDTSNIKGQPGSKSGPAAKLPDRK